MSKHTNTSTDLAALTPAQIDERLAKLDERRYLAYMALRSAQSNTWRSPESKAECIASAQASLDAVNLEMKPFDDEYSRRGGWRRYFLVRNANGHVHRGMSCSTCTPTTRYGWLTELSACDEVAMVEKYGDLACAVCFPAVQQHPAFLRAAAERKAREAREAATLCPKSNTFSGHYHGRYVRCECGGLVKTTTRGMFRKHVAAKKGGV